MTASRPAAARRVVQGSPRSSSRKRSWNPLRPVSWMNFARPLKGPGVGRPEISQGWTTATGRPPASAWSSAARPPGARGVTPPPPQPLGIAQPARPAPGGQAQRAAEGERRQLQEVRLPPEPVVPAQARGEAWIAGPAGERAGGERAVVEEPRLRHPRQPRAPEAAQGPLWGPEAKHRLAQEVLQDLLGAFDVVLEGFHGTLAGAQMDVAVARHLVAGGGDLADPPRQPLGHLAEHEEGRRAPRLGQHGEQLGEQPVQLL